MRKMLALTLLATLLGCGCACGEQVEFSSDDADLAYEVAAALASECSPRDAGTARGAFAASWLRLRARRAGFVAQVDPFTATSNGRPARFANVMAEFRAADTNAPWVVVMSHFDTTPKGGKGFQGANDGASTSGLLMAMGTLLKRNPPKSANVLLCWTDAEECRVVYGPDDGFQGSRHLLKYLQASRRTIKAAICLDMLGDRDLRVSVPGNTTPWLQGLAWRAARSVGASARLAVHSDIVIHDDHSAFFDVGIPAIDLIDFEYGSAPGKNDYWHTPADTVDKLSRASMLVSGRIATALLYMLVR